MITNVNKFRIAAALFLASVLLLPGCGGGGGSTSSSSSSPPTSSSTGPNIQTVIVDSGPAAAGGTFNVPFVTVTICAPAAPSNCQTIDHILLDTGSFGLRIMYSVLSTSISLPPKTDASGNVIVECTMFADGYSWGPVKTANLQMGTPVGSETATELTMQVIGDPAYTNLVPSNCSSSGPAENTVATFGANGVLGVGPFIQDCGNSCVSSTNYGYYYACSSASCQPTTVSLAQQVPNPVAYFASDNNGVIVSLPSVPTSGATSVSGTLSFGIGTQSNNGLGSAQAYSLNTNTGNFTTTFNGVSYQNSLLDSGSNGLFFSDQSIPQCSDGSGFYCPSSILSLSATNTGLNGASGTVNFEVANEANIFSNASISASNLLAGTNSDPTSFDWGLPFFFGRTVYTTIEGKNTPAGAGPYFAY